MGSGPRSREDRKSTRLNSSHGYISYAVFCLKKKKFLSRLDLTGDAQATLAFTDQERSKAGLEKKLLKYPQPFAASVFAHFFFTDTATTEIYTLSLHDALPI